MFNIFEEVSSALNSQITSEKIQATLNLHKVWLNSLTITGNCPFAEDIPGRPVKPRLVPPKQVPRRRIGSERGRNALMHSIAHIEFNAINLALDMVLRFASTEEFAQNTDRIQFISDWISVAHDEARHFFMIEKYLNNYGYHYGDFVAHNGLWEAALATKHDVAARLAIAPMVFEARGLDVTPLIIEKFEKNNHPESIEISEAIKILKVILEEEVNHVAFGTKWFNYFCNIRGKKPELYFQTQVKKCFKGVLKPPFNVEARNKAHLYEGFYFSLSQNIII